MTDRYRIVEFRDDNNVTFYTIQIECTYFFKLKYWRTLKSYSPDGSCSITKMFDTIEDARRFIRGRRWTNTVVEEGTV